MIKLLSLLVLVISCSQSKAQPTQADRYNTIDKKVYSFSKQKPNAPFDTITSFVNKNFQGSEDKARAYYTWITLNIEFDEDFRGSACYSLIRAIRDSNTVLYMNDRTLDIKRAASEGIADLMVKFCHSSNIPCYTVPGYIRQSDGRVSDMSFVWNVLCLDSLWVQVDASMANGYLDQNYKFRSYSKKNFFYLPPSVFIADHFPHDPMWQLMEHPCTKSEFFKGSNLSKSGDNYHFKDSLKSYQQKSMYQRKEIDVARYFKYEANSYLYDSNMELFYYNNASDKMAIGIENFNNYLVIGETKLSKQPLKADWKKAKVLLEKAELNFREVEIILTKMQVNKYHPVDMYSSLSASLQSNMAYVQKNKDYLEKLKPFLKDK
jgi:hypothetical protein